MSRVSDRASTKSAMHKKCQTQTKGAAKRARKTVPQFYTPKKTLAVEYAKFATEQSADTERTADREVRKARRSKRDQEAE